MDRLSDGGSIPPRSTSDQNIPTGKNSNALAFRWGYFLFSEKIVLKGIDFGDWNRQGQELPGSLSGCREMTRCPRKDSAKKKQRKFVHKRDINLWYSKKNEDKEALSDGVFKNISGRR